MTTKTGLSALIFMRYIEAKTRMNMTVAEFKELDEIVKNCSTGSRSDYDLKIEEIARKILL